MRISRIGLGLALGAFTLVFAQDDSWHPLGRDRTPPDRPTSNYLEAIRRTADMVNDQEASRLVTQKGLNLINLTWEDTGRYKNSAVGPNISDMTIQVASDGSARAMPVIRFPNFEDKTTDIDARDFTLLVGNEKGRNLKRVSLYDYLADPTEYMSRPQSWRGEQRTLVAPRDEKVLVSAQACFLPVPKTGKATFNPVLFNYQSVEGDPAVLTILGTREGTSMTIIDNKRDAFREGAAWGQRLFFNKNGMRTSLTGERLSDFNLSGRPGSNRTDEGLSMVLLIQVPLRQRHVYRQDTTMGAPGGFGGGGFGGAAESKANRRSDVEQAVIGHGEVEGKFTETAYVPIERDPNFPVRVTVQFYKATSNGIVNASDVAAVRQQIDWVYSHGDGVGSLVTQGETGRPTEYLGCKVQPAGWWESFWNRYESNMNLSRDEAIARLRRILGRDYRSQPVCDLYLRNLLRRQ